jgi:predicted nucleic acid-binding protein
MVNVYIDSDVIVASEIKEEKNHSESKKFMKYVLEHKNEHIIFFTSIFTFLELASSIIRRTRSKDKAYSLLYRIRNTWKDSINPLPPCSKRNTRFTKLVDMLIETSIKFKTPSGDTIHAQTVAENDIDYMITWNKKHFSFMKRQIKDLEILNPTEFLEIIEENFEENNKKGRLLYSRIFEKYLNETKNASHKR